MADVYWANSLFTEAQRAFNLTWVNYLRDREVDTFLPQELSLNDPRSTPRDVDLFRADTEEILRSRILVVVIDDETIDSGVAAEAGIAFAHKIPTVGLYTDFRRSRRVGSMYKNLYVTGLLNSSLGIVHSRSDLLEVVLETLETSGDGNAA